MMEGYPKAAEKFQTEANLSPKKEDPTIKARQEIQHAIHVGNIQKAISDLNELDPSVCSSLLLSTKPSSLEMIRTRVSTCTTHKPSG